MMNPAKKTISLVLTMALLIGIAAVPVYGANTKFTDTAGHKYESYIKKAAELSLFSGFDDGSFRPDATVTRAQFVTVLWRMKGSPASSASVPFTDTAGINDSYKKAIAWAYENNVVNGTTATTFNPGGTINRQQALTILYRLDGENSGLESLFTSLYSKNLKDYYDISSYAKKGVLWALYNGIAEAEDGKLQPTAGCSRALLSVYLVRYLGEDSPSYPAMASTVNFTVPEGADSSLTFNAQTNVLDIKYTGDLEAGSTYIALLLEGSGAVPAAGSICACSIETVSSKNVSDGSISFSLKPSVPASSTGLTLAIVSSDIGFSAKTVQIGCTVK